MFIDGGKREQNAPNEYPYEYLLFEFGTLEDLIDGFRTLSITGRELFTQQANYQVIKGIDGAIFLNANYGIREFEIEYILKTTSNEDMNRKYNKLNKLIKRPNLIFSTSDDKNNFYRGTVQTTNKTPKGTFNITNTFNIICTDPYKYSRAVYSEEGNNTLTLNDANNEQNTLHLEKIVLEPLAGVEGEPILFINYNDTDLGESANYTLKVDMNVAESFNISYQNAVLDLDFTNGAVTYGGFNEPSLLSIDSNFEDVKISSGTVLNCAGYKIKTYYRHKSI